MVIDDTAAGARAAFGDASVVPHAPAWQAARAIADGRLTAEAFAQRLLEHIGRREPGLRAWEHLDADGWRAAAREIDRQRARGLQLGPLAGLPVAIKDLFDTAGLPTRYGAEIHRGHVPARDAAAVALVRSAGGAIAGKTVTTEFAYFAPGPTRNPWNTLHTPGGSSSGSAAAVASGMVPLAFGSQTAASLIRPASYCGVFALKPTRGLFSLAGSHALSPSLDTIGWMARCADDLELLRAVLSGVDFHRLPDAGAQTIRLGLCRTHEWPLAVPSGRTAWAEAEERLVRAGVRLVTVDMPAELAGLLEAQKTIMACESVASFSHLSDGQRERLSAPLKALLAQGASLHEGQYQRALALAARGGAQISRAMDGCDAWITPAAPGTAPPGLEATGDPAFSRVWTLLGLPCVAVPGIEVDGLPVGLQLVGQAFQERSLLAVAAVVRRALVAGREDQHPDLAKVAP